MPAPPGSALPSVFSPLSLSLSPLLSPPSYRTLPLLLFLFLSLLPPSHPGFLSPSLRSSFHASGTLYANQQHGWYPLDLKSRRAPRSPLLPPTVTSYQTPPRRPARNTTLKSSGSNVSLTPPFARALSQPSQKRHPPQNGTHPPIPIPIPTPGRKTTTKIGQTSARLPRPPMVMQHSKPTRPNIGSRSPHQEEDRPVSARPQNDERSLAAQKQKEEMDQSFDESQRPDTRKPNVPPKSKKLYKFNDILGAINKTAGELEIILKRNYITFDYFLDFIENGRTKEEVVDYLKLSPSTNDKDFSKSIFSSKNGHGNGYTKGDRQNVLTDLPFTEIVHQVQIGSRKPFDGHLYTATVNKNKLKMHGHIQKEGYNAKWNTKNEKHFKENNLKFKKRKPAFDKQPYLSNSDLSSRPPNDSPMVIAFLQPKHRRDREEKASIISLTVEEEKVEKEKTEPKRFRIRNKILSTKEDTRFKKSFADLRPPSFVNSERSWRKTESSVMEEDPSNLRLVFPMKGIILFCGILGVIACVTIIILTVYGAVKCNRKVPPPNSYQMSENIEVTSS